MRSDSITHSLSRPPESAGRRLNRRAVLKTAAIGIGGSAFTLPTVVGSVSTQTESSPMHTLMITANGPVDYDFTVNGTLEADTRFGDFSADSDDTVFDPDGPANVGARDETGPRPEDAGENNFLGDRFRVVGYVQRLDVEPEPGSDAYVYLDEFLSSPYEPQRQGFVLGRERTIMITANGPTEYELLVEGDLVPDTEGGDFAADSDDVPTDNGDGTMTAADTTGPRPANAGGSNFLGDRYRFSGSVERLNLGYDVSQYQVNVYLDEQNMDPSDVVHDI
ncbi:hypothetical protein GJR96_08855 [Haloferax sp. MBLA0076]|uniref:Uncharacterized protein n=1 Tax=Haloferax litoreum TaxID=2666140 RepID=A0A6A8GFX0_9EURY|nr:MULTISPECIES: hypothetical protein [Haloferax]KAB1193548.1 hypothetical protein Hfx1148_08840 [Haloferax sp. CBA1148]MRX22063.1 hypothetical protein [Haloferax litoreum]